MVKAEAKLVNCERELVPVTGETPGILQLWNPTNPNDEAPHQTKKENNKNIIITTTFIKDNQYSVSPKPDTLMRLSIQSGIKKRNDQTQAPTAFPHWVVINIPMATNSAGSVIPHWNQ